MAAPSTFRVGIIIGSTQVHRVGPEVAKFVLDTITAREQKTNVEVEYDLIDLKTHNLPIFDEPGIPNQIKSSEGYQHEHTRVWSRRIAACDAIVFTSAQRNWGIPAELKNAIDYLFHEWKGKPGMLVTFGGHGGEQVAMHLKMVLGAIGMRLVDQMVNMKFPSRDTLGTAFCMLRKGLVMAAKLLFLRVSTKRVEVRSHYLSLASLRLAENCTKGHIVGREPHESCMHRECLEGCRRVSCPKSWGLDWALR
nr:nad(p)h-dependent fmn reductase lot6 [Quercus suber]